MQIQSTGLPLFHDAIVFDPDFAISRAGEGTFSPDTAITYLHYHDDLEIGYCYEGSGVFFVDDRIYPFSAGCASIIRKHEIHIARSSQDNVSKWKFIHIDPALLLGRQFPEAVWMFEPQASDGSSIVPPDDPFRLAAAVRDLIEETSREDAASVYTIKGLALYLFAALSRQIQTGPTSRRPPLAGAIKSVSAALDSIIRHYAQPLYIPDLAAACGMSEATFRRAFVSAFGTAPMDYIHNLRIHMAILQILYTTDKILDIALKVGYDSLSSFNRHFRRITGMSPRDYRGKGQS